jgi:hypothetical protein
MPGHRRLIIAIVLCCLASAGRCQSTNWRTLQCTKVSLKYPPTWHPAEESRGPQKRYTLTPDSMQRLAMRMFEMMEIHVDSAHGYAYFKNSFNTLLHPNAKSPTKILKAGEIIFKGHSCMYAEMTNNGLPQKVYAIDAGHIIYLVILTESRYSKIADPAMKRDGMAILNSITLDQ